MTVMTRDLGENGIAVTVAYCQPFSVWNSVLVWDIAVLVSWHLAVL